MKKLLLLAFLLSLIAGAHPVSAAEVTDVITNAGTINKTQTSSKATYTVFSGKKFNSAAVYAGKVAGTDGSIQLNKTVTNNIVTTASGGVLKKIKVVWNSNTSGNSLAVYASNTAYSASTSSKTGTNVGSIAYTSATTAANGEKYTEFTFPTDTEYTYLALFGASGATYSDRIEVTWEVAGASDYDPAYTTSEKLVKNGDGTYSLTLAEEEEFTLEPTTADGPTISYTSDNEDVAMVDNDGAILAMGQGTATITGSWSEVADTWNEGSVTINVTVTAADTRAEALMEWSATEASATLGGAFDPPTLTILPDEALSEVVYSSSDPSVAEIATNGDITVKAAGTTVVTAAIPGDNATYKPISVSYTLTVTDPSSTYYLVKSLAEFDPTQKCMLVAYRSGSYSAAMGAQNGTKYREAVALDIHSAALPEQMNKPAGAVEFTLEKADATTYYINVGSAYLSLGTDATDTKEVTQSSDATKTYLSFVSDYRVLLSTGTSESSRALGYNNSATRFASYAGNNATYNQVYLYQLRSTVEKEDADIDWDDIDTDAEVTRQLVGDCTFPTLTVMPDAAANSVRYTSSNEAVATIDPVSGEITRLAVGSTTITAKIEGDETYKNVYDTYKLTIVDDRDEVAIAFTPASATGYIRRADEFTWPAVSVTVNGVENADARSAVAFSSSNDEVMSIGSDYTDHNFLSYGTANIIATIPADNEAYKPVTATCAITVLRDEVTLTFDKATAEAAVFETFEAPQLTVEPNEAQVIAEVSYKSSNEEVASVDASTGEVTVYKTGTTTITASYAGNASFAPAADASYVLTVSDNRPTPTITWSCGAEMSYAMGAGEDFVSPTLTISGEGVVSDDVMALLTFETSNEAVATVSDAGVVEVKGEGTAVISATVPNGDATYAPVTASFTLTVSNSNPDVYYLTANGETFADGDYIIIAAADKTNFVSKEYLSGNDRKVYTLSEAAGSTITPTDADNYMIFKVVAAEGGVRLLTTNYGGTNGYATCAKNDNAFMIASSATDNLDIFNITYENGNDAVIKNVGNSRWMRYNASKFRFYSSNQGTAVYIYKKALAQKPDDPTFSQPDGTELTWQTAAVTVTSAHATKVYYRVQYYDADADEWIWSPDWTSVEGNYAVIYVHDPCHIEAYGENQYGKSETVSASYTIYGAGATIYNYINSLDQVDLSKKYILVNRDNKVAMGSYNKSGKYHNIVEIGVATDGTSVTAQSALAFTFVKVAASDSDPFGGGTTGDTDPTEPAAIKAREVAASESTYNMLLDNGNYMKLSTSSNETSEVATAAEATAFKVSFTDGMYVLLTDTESSRYLGCNFGSKRFTSYSASDYKITYLFQEGDKLVTGVEDIAVESADEAGDGAAVEWYTLQGVRVENPGTGFYIRRCGSKATKHLLK